MLLFPKYASYKILVTQLADVLCATVLPLLTIKSIGQSLDAKTWPCWVKSKLGSMALIIIKDDHEEEHNCAGGMAR